MTFGMKVLNSNNTTAYDSTSPGGVFVRFQVLPTTYTTGLSWITLPSQFRAMKIKIVPLQIGDHSWGVVNGNVESGQDAQIFYQNNNTTTSSVRRSTLLMVFAK